MPFTMVGKKVETVADNDTPPETDKEWNARVNGAAKRAEEANDPQVAEALRNKLR